MRTPKMMKFLCATAVLSGVMFAAERKVMLESLPPAVQTAVKARTRNATLVGLRTETEKGKTMYEVETKVSGKSRNVLLDKTCAVVETEEEVDLDTIPAAAKSAIQKRA